MLSQVLQFVFNTTGQKKKNHMEKQKKKDADRYVPRMHLHNNAPELV